MTPVELPTAGEPGARWRSRLSTATLLLAVLLLAATFLLISPRPDASYPGAIPWRPGSLLRPLVDTMSLGYAFQTERGVEIKTIALQVAALAALALFALRALVSAIRPPNYRSAAGAWVWAQVLLGFWVLISFASAAWSMTPALSLGQAALYAFPLAWAVALAWTLQGRDVPRLLWAYVIIATLGALTCAWYYHERNPFHRPGFPIGNPSPLAAVMLPAIFLAAAQAGGWFWDAWRRPADRGPLLPAIAGAVCLAPLVWCFELAHSRAALVGGAAGVAGLLFITTTRRMRLWVIVGSLVAAAFAAQTLSASMQDLTMARGATLRFRWYAWKYAAELWGFRPITGMGAGAYPRLANDLTTRDRVLDPAAFLGDIMEHAHNELFEVFAEIGLIGGVSFVAGHLASLVAGSALLQTSLSRQRRWLIRGLMAGIIALLADALFGVGPRLPGVPAVLFTLLGALWALARGASRQRPPAAPAAPRAWFGRIRFLAAGGVLAVIPLGAWAAQRDWRGVRLELAGLRALQAGAYEDALAPTVASGRLLLDPVRVLIAGARELEIRIGAARLEVETGRFPRSAEGAWEAALAFNRLAPNFYRAPAIAAEAAQLRAAALSDNDPAAALHWRRAARQAWLHQHRQRRYDRAALLALAASPGPLGDRLGMLRDGLRAGLPDREWLGVFRALLDDPDAPVEIERLVAGVAPFTPESELDALILSGAPEAHRLRALARFFSGSFAGAIDDAGRAIELYAALRVRLPTLGAVALAELSEYQFHRDPGNPEPAIAALRTAIESLPLIQRQEYDERAAPYRRALVKLLLAADREAEADDVLETLLPGDPDAQRWLKMDTLLGLVQPHLYDPALRAAVDRWFALATRIEPHSLPVWSLRFGRAAAAGRADFDAVCAEAAATGVPQVIIDFLRRLVCEERPELCRSE